MDGWNRGDGALNLHQLKIFHTVAKLGSFSRAAEELNISQPSVSIQVADLERSLGVELFEQIGKRICLTEAGRILDAYARRILALVEEANEAIEELKDLHRGHLAVGASTTPGIYLVPRALGEFRKRYPEVEIRLEVGSPPRIQQLLLSNDLDLGVMAGQPGSRDLVAEPFLEDELVAVVPPRHRLASQGVVRVEDFLQETVLLRERGSETRQVVDEALRQRGIHLPKVLEMTSPEAMKQAAASGLGIGLLSKYTIRLEVSAGLLVVLPIADLPMRRSFFLVRHRDKRLSRAAQVFVEILKAMHPQETLVGTPATE